MAVPFDPGYDPSLNVHMDMNAPQLRIIEQPKQYGFRFRYECEGKSHGGIPGISSERGKKTYPSTEIVNYKGVARIVVSLVTNEEMPRPHAHSLVGKHCTNGICSVQVGPTDMTASFPNLGILHITKKNVIPILKKRMFDYQETSKNLWGQSSDQLTDSVAEQRAKDLAKDMDLASVRLCFQAFLPDNNGHFTQPLPPVISVPIYDSKAPNATTLKICRMDRTSGSAEGGDEVYMLCDKVQKDDIQVRFFETSTDENTQSWEGFADFGPTDVHRQYAIVFKTPKYKNGDILKPVHVHIQLMRRSTKEKSEPKPFCYFPRPFDKDEINKKRQKILPHFTQHFGPMGQRFQGGGGAGGGGGGSDGLGGGGGGLNFQFGHSGNVRHMVYEAANSPMDVQINGVAMQERQPSPFNQSENMYQHNLPTIPTTQMQQQGRIIATPTLPGFNMQPVLPQQQQQQQQQQQRQQQHRQRQPQNQPQNAMQFPNFIARAASPDDPDIKLIHRGPKPSNGEVTKLVSRGLNKPSNMDTSDSGDSDLETDSSPPEHEPIPISSKMVISASERLVKPYSHCAVQTDYTDNLLLLAENTSRALYDYAITGDVKMILAVQRHLLAVQDDFGDTCLHMSIIHQEYEVTKAILAIIVQLPNQDIIDMPNDLQQTPLHLAVITNKPNTVELLMSNGADPNIADQHGNTPLHLSIQYGNIASVNALLQNSISSATLQADVNMLNHKGFAPIHIACRNGDLKSVKALCRAQCNIDIQDGTSGYTALHFAVEKQDFGILGYLLLDTNANVHEATFNGNTALHLATGRNLVAVAALLLASHADPLKENYDTYIDSSDSSDDENDEDPNMDISDDGVCGKTSLDLASTEEMRQLLNGEPFIKGPSTTDIMSEFMLGSEFTGTCDSFKIDSSTTSFCDPITLDKLARLLDQNDSWVEVAKRVELGDIVNYLRKANSPTLDLLYHFEKIDGTLEELKNTLSMMGRTDAVDIIHERSLTYSASQLKPLSKDYLDSLKDSGISEELLESLRRTTIDSN
ncbi:nuclear factor NF-kappa-B p105 subunit-like [Antedon mediterranea]|uniref:nuclear factor NF-kappa-B p105 subunit-like n=1 Tax=Antedon mediterranea TaxID=105859 RepID=UPI003AF98ACB